MRSRAWMLTPLVAAAVVLGGCVSIVSPTSVQPQSMGPLRLSFTVCASESPGCPAAPVVPSVFTFLAGSPAPDSPLPAQPLIAVRLPDGAVPPDALTASVAGGGTLGFARSPSYEAELQQFAPAPAGERWWGWLGRAFVYRTTSSQSFTVTFEVSLPRPADGGAFPSPLRWRPVVGARSADETTGYSATRPVDCGSTLTEFYEGFDDSIACASAPGPEATTGYLGAPLIDFGLTGTTAQASAGSTTTATFLARRTGNPDNLTTFALAVSGGPPGAAVTIDRTSVSLGGDAVTPVLATVAVPAGTAPGSYPVTLTATAAGKPTRTAVATVVVPDPGGGGSGGGGAGGGGAAAGGGAGGSGGASTRDTVKPVFEAASLSPNRFRAGARAARARRGRAAVGTTVRVRLSEPASLAVTVERRVSGRRAGGRCSPRARRGKRCSVHTRAGTLARRSVRAGASSFSFAGRVGRATLKPGAYRLSLVATDAAGNASAVKRLPFTVVKR